MKLCRSLLLLPLALAGCALQQKPLDPGSRPDRGAGAPPGPALRAPAAAGGAEPAGPAAPGEMLRLEARGPSPVELDQLAAGAFGPPPGSGAADRIDSPLPAEEMARLRRQALRLPAARIPGPGSAGPGAAPGPAAPSITGGFDSLDYTGYLPPDPELAAGPAHLIAVVNSAFEIYDPAGTVLQPATSLSALFAGTPGCDLSFPGAFDPNVLYDEQADRFLIGADGSGSSYCLAATVGPDPLGTWYRYAFATDLGGAFFDFPHAGVGSEAIFVGSNQFVGTIFLEGRLFAIDKGAVYAGQPAAVITASTGAQSTPQPVNLHGFAQGTWPVDAPHYVLTDTFDVQGALHTVWSWSDPFGAGSLLPLGEVDLAAATGVPGGMPIDAPQLGSAAKLQANDFRNLDAEYRNGRIWMAQTIACNPGGGTVDCVRWAEVDPAGPSVVQAGVVATDGEYRLFPDLAANHCGDLALGYTKTGAGLHPAVWATGRRRGDPPGTMQAEVEIKAGEIEYSAFDRPPHRWGDYSGLTPDPGGLALWYLGEYSKDTGLASGRWGNWVGEIGLPGCPIVLAAPAPAFPPVEVGQSGGELEVVVSNAGDAPAAIADIAISDVTHFGLDLGGGADPCHSATPVVPAGGSCTVTVRFDPLEQAFFDETLTVAAAEGFNSRVLPMTGTGYVPCPHPDQVVLSNTQPETGEVEAFACLTAVIRDYELAPGGRLEVTAGRELVVDNGTSIGGQMVLFLDPFLALP